MRIVSLLPSATEALCHIGGGQDLVGRSHECDHPADIAHLPVLTGQRTPEASSAEIDESVSASLASGTSLYHLDEDALRELAADLILTQDLCDVCSIDLAAVRRVASSMAPEPAVLSLNPGGLEDVYDDLVRIGEATGRVREAQHAVVGLRERFHRAADHTNPYADAVNTLFLEWADPPYVGGHWTPQLIERAGGSHPLNPTEALPGSGAGAGAHAAHRVAGKSVRVETSAIVESRPQAVVLCPCGFTLERVEQEYELLSQHEWFRALPAFETGRIALVDGNEMFNRPGPRLIDAFEWLVGWLNDVPNLIPEGFPWRPAPRC